jgi:S1-C subfamily serine protease
LELAPHSAAKGDRIHTVGNEGQAGNLWNYTQGQAALMLDWRAARSVLAWPKVWMLVTDMPINHGDSGGPVVSDAAKVVGVNDRGLSGLKLTDTNGHTMPDLALNGDID